jgi:hypothetical protein
MGNPPMNWTRFAGLTLALLAGCSRQPAEPDVPTAKPRQRGAMPAVAPKTLADARETFKTKPVRQANEKQPVPEPPPDLFQIVRYESAVGKLPAYLTPDPKDGKKHPAIIWITGGDCNSIGDGIWKEAPPSNDQSASAFRKAGIVMMFPSLRGGNENPGEKEGFYGEVDDVLMAFNFLAKQAYVDPNRIYLGGHSTGGTLVLLTAEMSDRFRATFAFGPVDSLEGYPPEVTPFDTNNRREMELRSPVLWLGGIRSPVFVIEGGRRGNQQALRTMEQESKNPLVHFLVAARADHFSVLSPVTKLLAEKILADDGPTCNIAITAAEVNRPPTGPASRQPAGKGK